MCIIIRALILFYFPYNIRVNEIFIRLYLLLIRLLLEKHLYARLAIICLNMFIRIFSASSYWKCLFEYTVLSLQTKKVKIVAEKSMVTILQVTHCFSTLTISVMMISITKYIKK